MVSTRFRADETSAKLTWVGLTAGIRHQKTGSRHTAGSWFRGPRRRGAHHPGSERPWVSRTVAISQHVPPSRYPGSITVIPSATWQICQTGKVPAYGTLPAVHRDRQISVYSRSQHRPEKIGHSFPYGQQPRRMSAPLPPPSEAAPALDRVVREVTDGANVSPPSGSAGQPQRHGTRVPWRSNALNPGFHSVRSAARASKARPRASGRAPARRGGSRSASSGLTRVPLRAGTRR